MKFGLPPALLATVLAFVPLRLPAFVEPAHGSLPDFDKRLEEKSREAPPRADAIVASEKLRSVVRGARISIDFRPGKARHVTATTEFLTPPVGERQIPPAARAVPAVDAHQPLKSFLDAHAGIFGHGSEALEGGKPVKDFTSRLNGLRTSVWEQRLDGIPVFEGVLIGHVTSRGELVGLSSQFIPEPARAADAGTPNRALLQRDPRISAARAVQLAAESIGEPLVPAEITALGPPPAGAEQRRQFKAGPLPGEARAQLVWLPTGNTSMRLCWQIELTRRTGGERYRVLLDAASGDVRLRQCLTVYSSPASFRVFTSDSPTPFSPGWPAPDTNQPPLVARSLVTLSALDTNASPLGWIADDDNETRGNNVDAHADRNGDDAADLPRPRGSPFRVFDPPLDLSQAPANSVDAAVVNLFYWCNWIHDRLYQLGFDEASGNYQKDNLGRGGAGGDAILADAQDGSGVNNANFTPAPDGEPGRVQMYLWSGANRDGDFDVEVILHEYTHGLSSRLVGGGVGIRNTQSSGLGEGWSDFYALALLSAPADDVDGAYAFGAYVNYLTANLRQNYYFGLRRFPYSTDLGKNPLTFKDIDPAQISPHTGVPATPLGGVSPGNAAEVHAQGEVWCAALWDARARLIRKHGFVTGNEMMLRLATDGMKLCPPNPNFLEARDALIAADLVSHQGAHFTELWAAFARRGMGFSATSPDSSTTAGVREAFDLPDALHIPNQTTFIIGGPPGGPFTPPCRALGLTNISAEPIPWSANADASWLTLSPMRGVLAPGAGTNLTVCVGASAAALSVGHFEATILFSNETTHVVQARMASLRVTAFAAVPFSDDFESGGLGPAWLSTGTGPFETLVTGLNGPHAGLAHVTLGAPGDGFAARNELTLGLDLAGFTNVALRFWAKSFGDEPDGPPVSPFVDGADFDGVAISADGTTWYEVQGLRQFGSTWQQFTVDLDAALRARELRYTPNFRIRFNHYDNLQIPFDGIALDDVSVTGAPDHRLFLELPPRAREGQVPAGGVVTLGAPADGGVTIALRSTDARLAVPATVFIPAGARSAAFTLAFPDNTQLDGTQTATLSAAAAGFATGSASMLIEDNEMASLQVTVPPRARAGAGLLAKQGRVHLNTKVARNIAVTLSTDHPEDLELPPATVIAAGDNSALFDITVRHAASLNGSHRATVTAHVDQWIDGADTMLVLNDSTPALTLRLPATLSESDGIRPGAGAVRLPAVTPTNVVVALSVAGATNLTLPPAVTVPAGGFEATFDLRVAADSLVSGTRSLAVSARAPGFTTGTAAVTLIDDESPPVPYQPDPMEGSTNAPISFELRWQTGFGEALANGGFENGDFSGWVIENTGFGAWSINNGTFDPPGPEGLVMPLAGRFSAVTAQQGVGSHLLYQDVFIPPDARSAALGWSDRIRNDTPNFSPEHGFRVEVRDTDDAVLAVAFTTAFGDPPFRDWTRRGFDLASFRGRTVRLAFDQHESLGYLNTHLDNVSVSFGAPDTGTSWDVYFGRTPSPGAAEFAGNTTNAVWPLTGLLLNTTYYWRVVARHGGATTPGPVWRFTTRGVGALDHFEWAPIASPQPPGQPFAVTLTARDNIGNVVRDFQGPVALTGLEGPVTARTIVMAEIDTGASDAVEFVNVSGRAVDISGWQMSLYDGTRWPAPFVTVTVPPSTICPAGGIFVLNRMGVAPGEFPSFYTGGPIAWNPFGIGNPVAALLRDASGVLIDFVCAADANPALITVPMVIPPEAWSGLPAQFGLFASGQTLRRQGGADRDSAADWIVGSSSIGLLNAGMDSRFTAATSVPLMPVTLTQFTSGVWSGALTVNASVPHCTLVADDGAGHVGFANAIVVSSSNDLSVALVDSPHTTLSGGLVRYDLVVSNSGPVRAEGVRLTNQLPVEMAFVSADTPDGSCSNAGNAVVCEFGSLAGGNAARATITARTLATGLATNRAIVVRAEPDGYAPNNSAAVVTTITGPLIWTTNLTVIERTGSNIIANFPVLLSAASSLPVSVQFATSNGNAIAGEDYLPASGTLVFAPGITSLNVPVTILGDALDEVTEVFFLDLTSPTNGVIAVGRGRAVISDDDPIRSVTVADVMVPEGPPGGTNLAEFVAQLSGPAGFVVSLDYSTADGTAFAGADFTPVTGTIVFPPGATQATFSVSIRGNDAFQSNRNFFVNLSSASLVQLARTRAVCTILDDDVGGLDRFIWSAVPSPQYAGVPFTVTLSALDGLGNVETNFSGPVMLRAAAGGREHTSGSGTNLASNPLGALFHDSRTQVIYLPAEVGPAGRLSALALDVATPPGQPLGHWTVRLQHTRLTGYDPAATWETNGWTTVYRRDEPAPRAGSKLFLFDTPFDYNGTDSLLVDFSFDNAAWSSNGFVRATPAGSPRVLAFQTDSGFGDPLLWSAATTPTPTRSGLIPNVRFTVEDAVALSPDGPVQLVAGRWTGALTVLNPGSNIFLRATDAAGRIANSGTFEVDSGLDADADGLPDAWEIRYFGSTNAPNGGPGDDPDGDGASNLQEFQARTDPLNPASALRIVAARVVGADVHVDFLTVAGKSYRLERADASSAATWKPVVDGIAGSGGIQRAIDPGAAGEARRFYRVRVSP